MQKYDEAILKALTFVLHSRDIGVATDNVLADKPFNRYVKPFVCADEHDDVCEYIQELCSTTDVTHLSQQNVDDRTRTWFRYWIAVVAGRIVPRLSEEVLSELHPEIRKAYEELQASKPIEDVEYDILAAVNLSFYLESSGLVETGRIARQGLCHILAGIPLRTNHMTASMSILPVLRKHFPNVQDTEYLRDLIVARDEIPAGSNPDREWFEFWVEWVVETILPRLPIEEWDSKIPPRILGRHEVDALRVQLLEKATAGKPDWVKYLCRLKSPTGERYEQSERTYPWNT